MDSQEETAPTAAAAAPTAAPAERSLFKKRERNANTRPRGGATTEPVDSAGAPPDAAAASAVVRNGRASKSNPMVQGTASERKRVALKSETSFASDARISTYDNKGTATNEQETSRDKDAQAQYELAQQQWKDGGDMRATDGTKLYRGLKAYRQYTAKAEDFDSQVMGGHGPARAPVHYRAVSRFDYQPDVCKDFKDTGYCGYGDACKFLHDRSDYKSGWQLDKMREEEQKQKRLEAAAEALEEGGSNKTEMGPGDNLPFACLKCREPWHAKSNPVVTKCGHYFCEGCALKHYQTSRRCFVCAEQTSGIFNQAKEIQEKIASKATAAVKLAEAGYDDDDDDDDEKAIAAYRAANSQSRKAQVGFGWAFK